MVIELITGHVFAEGSVTAVTPLRFEFPRNSGRLYFTVIGVGFQVDVYTSDALAQPPEVLASRLVGGFIRPEDYDEAKWYFSYLHEFKENWQIDRPSIDRERFERFGDEYFGGRTKSSLAQYIWEDSVSKLLGVASNRPSDTELLNFLDKRVERVVEGQTLTDPNGDHVANRWVVEQQSPNIRDAIHQLMKGHELNKEPT